jgi:cytochrome c
MDSFELNKIIAAILMVALLVIGLGKIADGVFHVKKPQNPGYQVEVESQLTSGTPQATEVAEKVDIGAFMTLGDIASGEKIFKKCAACHSINKGGKNKIGPALYNVVG